MSKIIEDGVKCKGYPVYRIVPSVCPVPGQLVWTKIRQSISGKSRKLIVSNVFTLVAEELVSLSCIPVLFLDKSICDLAGMTM